MTFEQKAVTTSLLIGGALGSFLSFGDFRREDWVLLSILTALAIALGILILILWRKGALEFSDVDTDNRDTDEDNIVDPRISPETVRALMIVGVLFGCVVML